MTAANKPFRKKAWPWIILILVIAAMAVGTILKKRTSLDIAYKETPAQRSELNVTILSTGVAQPENRLEIKPPVAGRVEQVVAREGQRVKKGQILAWMSSTERAALLDAARAKGPDELKRWEDLYRPTPIMAPISGTIILRNVEAGQTFTNNDPVFVMSDRLTIKAQVDETDISQVALKQRARIVLDAYPNQFVPGHVDQIAFEAKTVNNVTTYIVDVLPDETPAEMRSGMTANVTFFIASKKDALVVPSEGIKVRQNKHYVLVKSTDGKDPTERVVEIGMTDGKRTEITQGLQEGETILIAEVKAQGPKQANGGSPFSPIRPGGGRGR